MTSLHADAEADVVVIGGGLAGLACAVALTDAGLRITLLEASAEFGGRARSWTDEHTGDIVDIGPHILLTEYPNMRALLERLGTQARIVWQAEKLIRLIGDGECVDMRAHPLTPPLHLVPSMSKVGAVSLRDKASNSRATWIALQLGEEDFLALDRLSAADWLRDSGVSERFIEWFWASACMSLLNVPLEQCSAGALLRVYAQLVTHRRYRFGFAACGLGELFVPPALDVLRRANARVLNCTPAASLIERDGAVTGVVIDKQTRIDAQRVVLAVPPREADMLLPALARQEVAAHVFEPCPYISVYLWLDRKVTQERFWYRLYKPAHLNGDFYDLSNIRTGWGERKSVIASNIIFSHRADALSDEEIIAITLRELQETTPGARDARVVHARVHRIPMAVPCPAPGTERLRPHTRTLMPGLYLAGEWTRTALPACMEGAVRSGYLAAEAVLESFGRPCTIARELSAPEGLAGLVHRHAQKSGRARAYTGR